MTKRRLLLRVVTAVAVMVGLVAVPVQSAPAQTGDAAVTIQKSASVASAPPGTPFTYFLNYSCSSLTTTCDGVTITDVLPAQLSLAAANVSLVGDSHTSSTSYDPTTGTATWTMQNPLPAGTTGQVSVIVEFPPNTTPVGAAATNTVTISASNAPSATSAPTTVNAAVTPNIATTKALNTSPFVLDTNVTYTVTYRNSGNVDLNSPTLVDALPAGAVFVSASGGGSYDAATNQVTWVLSPNPALPSATVPSGYSQTVTVRYPSSAFSAGTPITNTVNGTGVPLGTATPISSQATVTNTPAAPAPAVTAAKSPAGDVALGRNFTYTVTAKNTGNVALNPVTVVDTLPSGATFVSCSNSCVFNATAATVTWTTTANLAANGGTFAPTVTVVYNSPTFTAGQTVTNHVSVSGTPITVPTPAPVTARASVNNTIVASATSGTVGKALNTTLQFAVNNPLVQYGITVKNTGDVALSNVVITDPLQAGAVFVSCSSNCAYDSSTNTVTWTLASLAVSGSVAVTLNVNYPSPPFNPGDSVTNCTTATAVANGTTIDLTPTAGTPNPGCTTNTLTANNPAATITKTPSTSTVPPGGSSTYTITATNTGNVGLSPFLVTDTLPTNMQANPTPATNVTFNDTNNLAANDTLQYRNSATGQLVTITPTCTGTSPQVCSAKVPTTAAQVIVTYGGQRGVGFVATVTVNLQLSTSAVAGDSIQNCATVSGPALPAPPPPPGPGQTACTSQTATAPPPTMTLTKTRTTPSPVAPPSPVGWQLVYSVPATSPSAAINPVITDCLPAGLDLVDPANPADPANGSPPAAFTPAPTITRVVNAPGCNPGVEVVWSWAGTSHPLSIAPGTSGTFTLNTQIQAGTAAGTLTNTANAVAANNSTPVPSSASVVVASGASLESLKLVKGSLDSVYTKYPDVGQTVVGGTADYQMTITNTGNVPINNVTAMDILPFVGDTSVLPGYTPRDSAWGPIMDSAVTSDTSGVTIGYSTSNNPCRNPELNVSPDSPGCVANSFSTTEPSPASSVASLEFSYPGTLAPGQTITLSWTMTTPVNAPVSGVAWNSFAYTGYNAVTGAQLISAEPNKVGIEVQPYTLQLTKEVNAAQEATAPGLYIPTGQPVTYTYLVTNPGGLTVNALSLVDSPAQAITCNVPGVGVVPAADAVIAPNSTLACTANGGPAAAGEHTDTATVSGQPTVNGQPAGPPTAPVTDTANYFGANSALTLVKDVNGQHQPNPPGAFVPVASIVTFSYLITNTGNVTLDPVSLDDSVLGAITCPDTSLAVGASMTCTTTAPAQAGQIENTATATGQGVNNGSPVGPPATATDTGNYDAVAPTVSTTVFDASNPPFAWNNSEVSGAKAYDSATLSGTAGGPTPTGTFTYSFYTSGDCTGTAATTSDVSLSATGTIPNSPPTSSLGAGSYSFKGVYSGDSNYSGSTGACEPFTAAKAPATAATVVFDNGTKAPLIGNETTGLSAYDTATVTGAAGFTPTGTVTYRFFTSGDCSGTATTTSDVTLTAAGTVPNSTATAALGAGSYSFDAVYSGDGNYSASTGGCEPFTVSKASAPPTTSVSDATTNQAWTGNETTGASAYDTATVPGTAGFTPTGMVTYRFFTSGDCSGAAADTNVTLTATGAVPNSSPTASLGAGSYSFDAVYSGDSNYSSSTGTCEPFSVAASSATTKTVVFDNGTQAAWAADETTGASAYDTATVTGAAGGPAPTGTVSYSFFTSGDCTGTAATTGDVTLTAAGAVPKSGPTAPLAAGSYSFQAVYGGDSNYSGSTGSCEPFSVAAASATPTTKVFDAATTQPLTGSETTGLSAYDTATVTGAAGVTPTGTVTYRFFTSGDCSGTPAETTDVTLAAGSVPNSDPTPALGAGSYSFEAAYSGDGNYSGSTGSCEPFSVAAASATPTTKVFDAATTQPLTGSETTGLSAYDTATVTGAAGVIPTGTVTYRFFTSGDCSGTPAETTDVTLAAGSVPKSDPTPALGAGSYSFEAAYSGDGNYSGSTGVCEPFTVAQGPATTATVVFDSSTHAALVGSETTGLSAYDTATVTGAAGVIPTGTVTYSFFTSGDCSGKAAATSGVTLTAAGTVPDSAATSALAAGSHSFRADYSGDSNYTGSSGDCEPFTVGKADIPPATTVFDAATHQAWTGKETAGASAFDTATLRGAAGVTPTGAVTYNFFTTGDCSGTAAATGHVTLTTAGAVPSSAATSALGAGSYSFRADYRGDSNYESSIGACESFSVAAGPVAPTPTSGQPAPTTPSPSSPGQPAPTTPSSPSSPGQSTITPPAPLAPTSPTVPSYLPVTG